MSRYRFVLFFAVWLLLGVRVQAATGGTPDPTLLPVATTSQFPNTSAYNALNVPGLAAGGSYLDPTTGVRVYKVTSSSFPTTGFPWVHDYAEGGDEVSLPLDANGTRVVHILTATGNQWLVDFTPGVGVSNPRSLTNSAFPPFMNLCVAFSNNPATPYYMYVSTGATIYRVDMRTMTEAPGNGWPVTGETEAMWLHQSENDTFFTWMRGANGSTIVGYEPATATKKTYTNAGLNEPRIDRDANNRSVCISMTTPQNQGLFWDWRTNTIVWSSPTQSYGGEPPIAHQASLRGYWVGVQWTVAPPLPFWKISATPNSQKIVSGAQSSGSGHCNGNWIQHPANADDQWFACYVYGALNPPASENELAPGGILLSTVNGQRRILAHLYNTATDYSSYAFVKMSPDGRYALFTSNMDGSARTDLFLAEMPTTASAPPPPDTTSPTASITAPANGATVSGSVSVTATASDNVGVVGVQFQLDGANLGAEDTTSPYATTWNTTTATNGTHTLTAVARDAAGNRGTSAAVSVTVSNVSDTTPPSVPTGLTATATSSSQINLSWTASTDAVGVTGYKIYRGTTQIATSPSTSYSDAGLSASTTYTYTVAAYDAAGNTSAQSASASATTLAPPPPPTAGNIMLLHLDEAAGATSFADATGTGNNGSCTACPTAGVAGKVKTAASFSGSSLITVATNTALNAYPLTVTAWFKTASTTGVVGLVNKYVAGSYNGYNVFMNNGNVCAWYIRDTTNFAYDNGGCTFSVAGFNDNQWHQVAYVVDAAGARIYLDGVQKGSIAWTGTAGGVTTTQDVHVGHYPGAFGGVEYFTGSLDEVRIYNTALTATDITSLYNSENTPATPPPDTTQPTVSVTAPVAGATVSGSITLTATASDNVGVAGVQFQVDGINVGSEDTVSPYSTTWNTTTATNGAHTITAIARDAAGNRGTSAAISVTVSNSTPDTTAPTVSLTAPLNGASISGNVTVSATASDNVGVAGVQFQLDGAALGSEDTVSPYSTTWNTATAANGSHTLTAVARDAAGNRQTSAAVTVTVTNTAPDTTPPTVPTGLTATPMSTSQINLTWNASTDSGSGMAGYKVYRGTTQVGTTSTTTYSDNGLAASTTYTYTVAAYDVAGNTSAQSPSVSATTKAATPPPTVGNIMLLHLDESAGATAFADATGSGNNGSCIGAACPSVGVVGKVGTAASFNGADMISVVNTNALNAYPLTVSTWFKTSATTGVVGLVNKYVAGSYNGYNVFMNNGNVCAWYIRDTTNFAYDNGGCTFNVPGFNDNAWHQVVYVVDAAGARLYLDGAQKGTIGWTGVAGGVTTTQDVEIGHYPGAFGGVEYFTGSLDEVRIYNTALSASDVTALYNAENTPSTPPPDTTQPTATITAPASGATVSGSVALSANASDNVGVVGVQFQVDGANVGVEDTAAPYTATWNTTAATNGTHTITAIARDAAGNRGTSPAVSVTVSNSTPDTTAPTVPSGLTATAVSSSQINLTWNASTDSGSGMAGYKVYRAGTQIGTSATTSYSDSGLSASTAYTYTVAAYDAAGNTSAQSASASATTQTPPPPPPTTLLWLPFEEKAGSSTFADVSGSNNNGSCIGTGCPTAGVAGKVGSAVSFDGSDMVTVTSNAALDAYPLTVVAWFKTSLTTGVVGIVNKYIANSYNGYNVFMNNGNICAWYIRNQTNYAYDGSGCTFNVPGFNDNQWHQVAYVVDASGARLYLDGAQKGTIGWTGTAGGVTTTQDVHVGHYPGAFGGVEYYQGLIDEVRIYNKALSATDINSLYASDNAPPPDTTSPTVSITAPQAGSTVAGNVTLTATASDNVGVVGVQFAVDGIVVGTEVTTAPYSISWSSNTFANGTHSIVATARDAAGNRGTSAPVSITVANSTPDTTSPSVQITAPAAGATVSGTVSVTAAASDNVGVAGVQFQLDGAPLGAEVLNAPYSVSWNTTTSANGSHSLTAVARDAAGNRMTSAVVSVSVLNGTPIMVPPTVTLASPADGSALFGSVTISANASNNVTRVQFLVDGGNYGAEVTSSPFAIVWDTTTALNGAHTITAVAHDAGGASATSSTIHVTVANTAIAYHGTPSAIPGRIEAEDFDRGGEGSGYHDLTPQNTGGYYRTSEAVDIINPFGNTYVVDDFQTGEWLAYTVSVTQSGTYSLQLLVSATNASSKFHVEVDGVDVTGSQSVPSTGSFSSFTWVGPSGISLRAGAHVLKVVADHESFYFDAIQTSLEATAPAKTRGVRH